MNSYPIIILLFSILFCTATTVLAVMLKRSNSNKDKLLAEMQASLSSLRETDQDGAIFEDDLRSAELTTRFQQPRLSAQQQSHSAAPERYRYIQSMVEMNLSAEEIAATLSMSLHETTQIITLIRMANPPRQDDASALPSPEGKNSRSNQHSNQNLNQNLNQNILSRWTTATKNEKQKDSGDGILTTALCEDSSASELKNDCHRTKPTTTQHPGKKCASHQPPASAQSGVVHRSRKLARWLRIRALPTCLRSQGSREPPRKPLPCGNNLSPAPLSGYT